MMETRSVPTLALGLAAVVLLAACNLADQPSLVDGDDSPTATAAPELAPIEITEVSASSESVSSCPDDSVQIRARLAASDRTVAEATLQYRLSAGDGAAGAWLELPMQASVDDAGGFFLAELPAPADAGSGANVEYIVNILDGDGQLTTWPASEDSPAMLPFVPCDDVANPSSTEASVEFQVHDYGVSPTSIQYGSCATSTVTFDIILSGYQQVSSIYVKTTWLTGQGLGDSSQTPLIDAGPAEGYPAAHRFAVQLNLSAGAQANLGGDSGNLGWNIYVEREGEATGEYPAGGPPVIATTPCPGLVIVPLPTATKPIVLLPLPTATPMILINPGTLAYNQGQETMLEGQFFDLDEGEMANGGPFVAGDFHLDAGDDPYLDDIRPLPGTYFGWYGAQKPSKTECENTLKAVAAQTIQWPGQQDTYYCYETNQGRAGWLRVDQWVSLPINERRFEFTWFTFP